MEYFWMNTYPRNTYGMPTNIVTAGGQGEHTGQSPVDAVRGNFRDNIRHYNGALAMAFFAARRWRCLPVSCIYPAVLLLYSQSTIPFTPPLPALSGSQFRPHEVLRSPNPILPTRVFQKIEVLTNLTRNP